MVSDRFGSDPMIEDVTSFRLDSIGLCCDAQHMKTPRVSACRKTWRSSCMSRPLRQRAPVMAGAQWDVAARHIHHERCVQSVSICPPPTTGGQRERHDGLDVDEEFGR
jgi:hypothetical protein